MNQKKLQMLVALLSDLDKNQWRLIEEAVNRQLSIASSQLNVNADGKLFDLLRNDLNIRS